jgi:AraC-like DNA-binding protein
LPSPEKIKIISTIISNNSLISQEPEGILPAGWAVMIRVLYGLGTNIAQFVLLAKNKKRILDNENKSAHNVAIFRWLFFFTFAMSLLYLLLIVIIGFQLTLYFSIWQAVILSITVTILFICLTLLISPTILYGLRGWIQKTEIMPVSSIENTAFTSDTNVQKRLSLSNEKGKLYKVQIEKHFAENHPYIKGGYTIAELSKELDIPSYILSAFINQEYGKNFNELINEYRVDYFLNLVKQPNLNSQYKLETLGNQAGFNTRASFIRAVKKKTGLTPSDFVTKKND